MTFESELSRALESKFQDPLIPVPRDLADSIRYSLLAPGKRIRPRLLLKTARMLGVSESAALPAAIALEMIHCFTLIHDDLPCMDDDDFRRGVPSNHKKFGESTALLAGDSLVAMAIETFLEASSKVESKPFTKGLARLVRATGPRGVCGGQAAESELGPGSKLEDLRAMHARKTGSLFDAAILIPADFLGLEEGSEKHSALQAFSSALGHAFQVADDLEDDDSANPDPSSVLRYQTPQQARSDSKKALCASLETLERIWPNTCEELALIAREVERKLEAK